MISRAAISLIVLLLPALALSHTYYPLAEGNYWLLKSTDAEEPEVIRGIRDSGADLLLVAMGAPRQDLWIQRHLAATGVKVAMGVGGLFDFYSGRIPRAPRWVREIGLEWLYRFSREPRRMWRRYFLGNPLFLARVLMEKGRGRLPEKAR